MKIHYSITKEQRKKMVEVIGTSLGTTASYCGVPSFSYKVGAFEITRDGCLCFADDADEAEVERVRTALREEGFAAEEEESEMTMAAVETAGEAAVETAATTDEENSLTISLPRSSFTETALKNLDALLASKGKLIQKAFNIEKAAYTLTEETIKFACSEAERMRKMKTKMYIAYGSNMDLEQMQRRCSEAELLGTGRLENWRLMFKGSKTGAYATIEKEKGQNVPILLWRITAKDEERLDRYEGFPTFYYKRTIQAVKTDADGKPCGMTRGMAYIMHEERTLGIPSMEYFDILYRAYCRFGFDRKILEEAYGYTWEWGRKAKS